MNAEDVVGLYRTQAGGFPAFINNLDEEEVMIMRKETLRRISVVTAALFFLSGCASKMSSLAPMDVKYYPQCYKPVQELVDAEKKFNDTIMQGILIGAATGALLGALSSKKDRGKGALIGALGGALVGGIGGYMKAKQDQIADDAARLASYQQDAEAFAAGLDAQTAAADASRVCYDNEMDALVAKAQAKKVSKEEAMSRFTEISNGLNNVSTIFGKTIETAKKQNAEFEAALNNDPALVEAAKLSSGQKKISAEAKGAVAGFKKVDDSMFNADLAFSGVGKAAGRAENLKNGGFTTGQIRKLLEDVYRALFA